MVFSSSGGSGGCARTSDSLAHGCDMERRSSAVHAGSAEHSDSAARGGGGAHSTDAAAADSTRGLMYTSAAATIFARSSCLMHAVPRPLCACVALAVNLITDDELRELQELDAQTEVAIIQTRGDSFDPAGRPGLEGEALRKTTASLVAGVFGASTAS